MVEAGTDPLDPDRVIEARTVLGPLWVERDAEILTRSLLEVGRWDRTVSGLLENVLRPGMTFVDAGANIGWFSILGSRLVGPSGRVFSIEPDPFNLSILRANLERNGCSNVTVVPVAAWSERTDLDFAVSRKRAPWRASARMTAAVCGSPPTASTPWSTGRSTISRSTASSATTSSCRARRACLERTPRC